MKGGARGDVSVDREKTMRTLMIASAGIALMAGGAQAEQRVIAHGPGVAPRMTPMMNHGIGGT